MSSRIKLSICIPTYNRSRFLNETLKSISSQLVGEYLPLVEVCISDNASSDDTEAMVAWWVKKSKFKILYSKCDVNEGADKNYLRAVSLASGEYCWLFGSDDLFVDGAISTLVDSIASGSDIYLCNRINCDANMNQTGKQNWLLDEVSSRVFDFTLGKDINEYFKSATSIGALFSYLSSLVFRRALWNSYEFDSKYFGTAYAHVYMLLSMVKGGCELSYIKEALVLNRGGNDSFLERGSANRILIDLFGYSMLADDFFLDTEYYDVFLDVLRKKERPIFRTVISLRYYSDENEWERAEIILKRLQYPAFLIDTVSNLKPVISLARNLRLKLSWR